MGNSWLRKVWNLKINRGAKEIVLFIFSALFYHYIYDLN